MGLVSSREKGEQNLTFLKGEKKNQRTTILTVLTQDVALTCVCVYVWSILFF